MIKYLKIGDIWFSIQGSTDILEAIEKRKCFAKMPESQVADIVIECSAIQAFYCVDSHFLEEQDPVFTNSGLYREIHGVGTFKYTMANKHIDIQYVDEPSIWPEHYAIIADTIFQFIYLSLMDFGLLPLHAAAVAANNGVYAIMGNSGKGKSTLLLSMLNAKYDFFADDVIFVDERTLQIICSGEHIVAMTSEGAAFWRQYFVNLVSYAGTEKQIVSIGQLGVQQQQEKLPLIGIIFPIFTQTADESVSQHVMPCAKALQTLVENSVSRNFPSAIKRRYYRILTQIANSTRCLTLERKRSCPIDHLILECKRLEA